MIVAVILVALLLAFLAFRFVMGAIKWLAIFGVIVLAILIGRQSGAF